MPDQQFPSFLVAAAAMRCLQCIRRGHATDLWQTLLLSLRLLLASLSGASWDHRSWPCTGRSAALSQLDAATSLSWRQVPAGVPAHLCREAGASCRLPFCRHSASGLVGAPARVLALLLLQLCPPLRRLLLSLFGPRGLSALPGPPLVAFWGLSDLLGCPVRSLWGLGFWLGHLLARLLARACGTVLSGLQKDDLQPSGYITAAPAMACTRQSRHVVCPKLSPSFGSILLLTCLVYGEPSIH